MPLGGLTFAKRRPMRPALARSGGASPGGGIGRRAGFRCQWLNGREGSSPFLGTIVSQIPKGSPDSTSTIKRSANALALFFDGMAKVIAGDGIHHGGHQLIGLRGRAALGFTHIVRGLFL